jgi:hypothetical protein
MSQKSLVPAERVIQLDLVTEASELSDHLARPRWLRLLADGRTSFFVPNTLVKNLPNQTTQAVSDRWSWARHRRPASAVLVIVSAAPIR